MSGLFDYVQQQGWGVRGRLEFTSQVNFGQFRNHSCTYISVRGLFAVYGTIHIVFLEAFLQSVAQTLKHFPCYMYIALLTKLQQAEGLACTFTSDLYFFIVHHSNCEKAKKAFSKQFVISCKRDKKILIFLSALSTVFRMKLVEKFKNVRK